MFEIVYKCTSCGKVSQDASNICSCTAPRIKRLVGRFEDTSIDDASIEEPSIEEPPRCPPRSKPGPKPVNPAEVLRGAVTSRDSEESDDLRIDALFDPAIFGEIQAFLGTNVFAIPGFLFERLWGKRAPPRFRSLFLLRGNVFEVESHSAEGSENHSAEGSENPIQENAVAAPTKFCPAFSRDFAVYLLEFAFSICKHSVPARLPDDPAACRNAARILDSLRATNLRGKLKASGRLDPAAREFLVGFHALVSREMSTAFT